MKEHLDGHARPTTTERSATGRSSTSRSTRNGRRVLAASLALGTALALAVPSAASAQGIVSQGNGRLVRTSLLSSAVLDSLATLKGANALNTAAAGDVIVDTPLDAVAAGGLVALKAGPMNLPLFGNTGVVRFGLVGQYGRANNDGSSVAFSGTAGASPSLIGGTIGAVTPGPAIGTPAVGSSAEFAVSTATLLGGPDLVSIDATVGVLAAAAHQNTAGVQSGAYRLTNFGLDVGGTLVAAPASTIRSAIDPVVTALTAAGITTLSNPFSPTNTVHLSLADLQASGLGTDLEELAPDTNLALFIPAAAAQKISSMTAAFLAAADTAISALPAADQIAPRRVLLAAQVIITPLVAGLGSAFQGILGIAVNSLAQLIVNHKEVVNGTFTETALRLGLGAGGALAQVDLASASVGPNAGPPIVQPTTTPTTDPGTGGGTGTGGGAGTGGGTGGSLAHTGMQLDAQLLPWGGIAFLLFAVGAGLFAVTAKRRRRSASTEL